ncbi:DUF1799 domain-containing protein [Caldimonas tepidiphila]|uniref:DUF1799 domain-containing protein n=1 Tax=Caldimonas tepidiphila TaxID=2315841 RepID=UPI000E5BF3DE|nr:DUF1799 domain-containing protein [Caldimonas tepidiphila]
MEAARLWARGELRTGHDDEPAPEDRIAAALAAVGLVAEGEVVRDEPFYLWPEHVAALQLWNQVQTQWRVGLAGRTGFDYPGIEVVMRRRFRLRGREADERFAELQIMERAALAEWARQREGGKG